MALETEGKEASQILTLLAAVAVDGAGPAVDVSGYASGFTLESEKTGTGTCTLTINGSFDKTTWYPVRFAPVDGQTALTTTVTPISVGVTNPLNHTYLIQDRYPFLQAVVSATAGAYVLTVKLFVIPV